MKRLALILAAALVVLAANGWVLFSSSKNRSAADGGRIELTERELRLPPMMGDSTAILLNLLWRNGSSHPDEQRFPQWLDAEKLTELGFDCSVPVVSPHAREHYSANRTAVVYLVLEYEGAAWKQACLQRSDIPTLSGETHLFAIDAGTDPRRLREEYPNSAQFIITRGEVRLHRQERRERDGQLLPQPRLRGAIQTLMVKQVFVPAPHSQVLQALRRRLDESREQKEPRFAATVSWGKRFEPWVESVRLLPGATGEPNIH